MTSEFTKQLLIEKILQYWKQHFYFADGKNDTANERQIESTPTITTSITESQASKEVSCIDQDNPEHFPINKMARMFANWFYDNLNSNRLQATDFWSNCKCSVQFLENQQCVMQEEHVGAVAVLEFCQSLLSSYNLYFNLNVSHSGTQGRIDCHGLVLVLTCGTLHKVNQFVGTFETVFGLSRDPFSQNNWKMNQINIRLHNFNAQQSQNASPSIEQPTLVQSDSILPLLRLSMPSGDDEIR